MLVPIEDIFLEIKTNNHIFSFTKKYDDNGIYPLAISDLDNCYYTIYYENKFDKFFIDDNHKRRFVTFVESLSSNDIFLKAKLKRVCKDTILYLQNHKKVK